MATIQEQLRSRHEPLMDGKSTWVKVPVCTKAADVIDALVEALEAAKGDVNDHKVYVQIDAALSRARGDIPTES